MPPQGSYIGFDQPYTFLLRIEASDVGDVRCVSGDLFAGQQGDAISLFDTRFFAASFSSTSLSVDNSGALKAQLALQGPLQDLNSDPPTPIWTSTGRLTLTSAAAGKLHCKFSFTGQSGVVGTYEPTVTFATECLREVIVETDYVADAATIELLDAARLSLASIAKDRGLRLRRSNSNSIVADLANAGWEERDLVRAMKDNFASFDPENVGWRTYMLVAPRFIRDVGSNRTYGLMFDAAETNPGDTHNRQGAAVFWQTIKAAFPDSLDRNFQRTYLHELCHAFNLIHTKERRPSVAGHSLSVMNYPEEFGGGAEAYLSQFNFDFEDFERQFLYHGHHQQVVMGGFHFSANNYLEEQPTLAKPQSDGVLSLELEGSGAAWARHSAATAKRRSLFRFAEPIVIEAKLTTLTRGRLTVPDVLAPSHGIVRYSIRRPDGRTERFRPRLRRCGERASPAVPAEKPSLYERICLSYGGGSGLFANPGRYLVQATLTTPDGIVASNILPITIAYPSREEDEVLDLLCETMERNVASYMYHWGDPTATDVYDLFGELADRLPETDHGVLTAFDRYRYIAESQGLRSIDRAEGCVRVISAPSSRIDKLAELTDLAAVIHVAKRRGDKATGKPGGKRLDNIAYSQTAGLLIEELSRAGEADASVNIAHAAADELKQRKVPDIVVDGLLNDWARTCGIARDELSSLSRARTRKVKPKNAVKKKTPTQNRKTPAKKHPTTSRRGQRRP